MGTHIKTGQKIAAKIIPKDKLREDNTLLEKIQREIRFSKYFRHPNVIRIYEIIERKNEIILIMEFATGGELYDYMIGKTVIKNFFLYFIYLQYTVAVIPEPNFLVKSYPSSSYFVSSSSLIFNYI